MRPSHPAVPVLGAVLAMLVLWAGCSMMPEKEPPPEELAILFTASTGAEIEPCG